MPVEFKDYYRVAVWETSIFVCGIRLPQMTVVLKNDRHVNGKQEKQRTG